MKIPEKIKVGYREYKLEKWKQTVANAGDAHGQFFAKEGVIGYTAEETGVSHANTILHELFHSIIYQWNIDLDEKTEEIVVNGLTNGLTTVFVDNPELVDYLKIKIKEG
jgi:hypothetical protein